MHYGPLFLWEMTIRNPKSRSDPLYQLFPPMAKCSFYTFGPSGTAQREDSLCIIHMNILNEKIFMILWTWFFLLAVATALHMFYLLMVICIPPLRSFKCTSQRSQNDELINWQISMRSFGKTSNVGDWFFLGLISINLNER